MAFLSIEDIFESVEVVVFPEAYSRCEAILSSSEPVIVTGFIQKSEKGVKLIAETLDGLADARDKYTQSAVITVHADKITASKLEKIKKLVYQHHGSCPFSVTLHFPGLGEVEIETMKDLTIRPSRELNNSLESLLEYKAISFQKKPLILNERKKSWKEKNK